MPYIMTYCWYPFTVNPKVAQRYLENLQKYPIPAFIKRLVPAANSATKDGLEILNIDEVKPKDLGEAFEYINVFMSHLEDIEGLSWNLRVFSTVTEGLKRLGMG